MDTNKIVSTPIKMRETFEILSRKPHLTAMEERALRVSRSTLESLDEFVKVYLKDAQKMSSQAGSGSPLASDGTFQGSEVTDVPAPQQAPRTDVAAMVAGAAIAGLPPFDRQAQTVEISPDLEAQQMAEFEAMMQNTVMEF